MLIMLFSLMKFIKNGQVWQHSNISFTKILEKKNKFPDILKKTTEGKVKLPTRAELPILADKIAKTKNTAPAKELARLTKEKAFVEAVPYAFSLLFMGFTLSAITRLWTQFRYNHQAKELLKSTNDNKNPFKVATPEIFKEFETNKEI